MKKFDFTLKELEKLTDIIDNLDVEKEQIVVELEEVIVDLLYTHDRFTNLTANDIVHEALLDWFEKYSCVNKDNIIHKLVKKHLDKTINNFVPVFKLLRDRLEINQTLAEEFGNHDYETKVIELETVISELKDILT